MPKTGRKPLEILSVRISPHTKQTIDTLAEEYGGMASVIEIAVALLEVSRDNDILKRMRTFLDKQAG